MRARRTSPRRMVHLYVTLTLLALGRFSDPAAAAAPPLPTRPFRARDWDLAWTAFVGAGEVDDAYALSRSALKARPRSRVWLNRLAESARWSNHPRAALAALSRLALAVHQTRDLQPALDLAIGLGEDGRAVPLLRELIRLGRATPAERRMLSSLYLNIDEPEHAIRALQREFARRHTPELLWEQAVIYRNAGEPQRELATLQRYRKHFGAGPKVMLAIATIDYLHNRWSAALDALRAAEPRARPTDIAYWRTLSGLAWSLGRYRLAAHAAIVLIESNEADASLYLRAVYAQRYRHPKRAFAIAARGWTHTHEPTLFLSMLDIAASIHPAEPWLARAFALLGPAQAKTLADSPAYWTSLAELRSDQGNLPAALEAYRQALRRNRHDTALLADCLWLLIDKHDFAALTPILQRLPIRARAAPQLWAPLAAAYAAVHRPERALPWLQMQWPTRKNDPLWLIDYADILQQTAHPDAAWRARRRAYDLLTRHSRPAREARTRRRRQIGLAQLAMVLTPGDPARRAIESLARHRDQRQARVTVLAWMQSEGADALARWWRLHAFEGAPPPAWARLAQALSENDGPALAAVVKYHGARLSPRAQSGAAAQLGWTSLALTRAFQGLEREPRDPSLQHQFDTLALARADRFGALMGATETSGLLEDGVRVQARHWLGAHERLSLRVGVFHQRSVNRAELGRPPALNRSAELTWRHTTQFGHVSVLLGAGKNIASWLRAGVSWHRRWNTALQTTLGAIAGARPLDTAALSVGALEDRVQAGASMQLTPRTQVQAQLQAGRLRAQGGGTLGGVQRFSLAGDYQLSFTPTAFGLNASVSGAHYSHAAHLPVQLRPLVPAQQTPTVGFFVPRSFVQACAGGHFDMRYEKTFTSQFRPYASASLCANSISGQGYNLSAGIAMPVLGADHLALSVNLENNVGTHSGRTAQIMLRYHHYFTSIP